MIDFSVVHLSLFFPKQLELLGVLTSQKKRIRSNPRDRGACTSHFGSLSRMFISFQKQCILQCFWTVALGIRGNLHGSLSLCSKNLSFYHVFEHLQYFLSITLRDPCKVTWIPKPGRTTNWTLLNECSFCTFFTRFLRILLQKPQFLHCLWSLMDP